MKPSPPMRFDACLELLAWGRNVYTIIKVPDELAALAREKSTRRVAGHLDEIAVNVGLNRADVTPETFIYAGSGLLKRLGARPGDVVHCRLAPADPDLVPVPEDLAHALEAAGRRDAFERKPASERRRLLAPIESAARPETRHRRLHALIASLPVD